MTTFTTFNRTPYRLDCPICGDQGEPGLDHQCQPAKIIADLRGQLRNADSRIKSLEDQLHRLLSYYQPGPLENIWVRR